MPARRSCRAATATLATVLLVSLAPPAAADTASDEARVVALVQQARAAAGAPALPLHAGLTAAARTWALTMAAAGTISHNVGLGSLVSASRLAENVGMGASVDAIHQSFLASSGHLANLLDTRVNAIGVGVAYANGYVFVVQDFAMVPPNRRAGHAHRRDARPQFRPARPRRPRSRPSSPIPTGPPVSSTSSSSTTSAAPCTRATAPRCARAASPA